MALASIFTFRYADKPLRRSIDGRSWLTLIILTVLKGYNRAVYFVRNKASYAHNLYVR